MKTGEDKDYSQMTSVELKKLFRTKKVRTLCTKLINALFLERENGVNLVSIFFQIHKVTETNLSANQERAEMETKRLVCKVEGSSEEPKVVRGGPVDPKKLVVELAPMEIRTFLIDIDYPKMYDF